MLWNTFIPHAGNQVRRGRTRGSQASAQVARRASAGRLRIARVHRQHLRSFTVRRPTRPGRGSQLRRDVCRSIARTPATTSSTHRPTGERSGRNGTAKFGGRGIRTTDPLESGCLLGRRVDPRDGGEHRGNKFEEAGNPRSIRLGLTLAQARAFVERFDGGASADEFLTEDEVIAAARICDALRGDAHAGVGEVVAVIALPADEHDALICGDTRPEWPHERCNRHWSALGSGTSRIAHALRSALGACA